MIKQFLEIFLGVQSFVSSAREVDKELCPSTQRRRALTRKGQQCPTPNTANVGERHCQIRICRVTVHWCSLYLLVLAEKLK